MCMSLYSQESNAQVLEGRCEWVLARLHMFTEDFEKAKMHIDTNFTTMANCAKGEERFNKFRQWVDYIFSTAEQAHVKIYDML